MDEGKRSIHRAIVEKYLSGIKLGHIAIWLTDNKIPTPYNIKQDGRDKGWSNMTVQRLLLSEIHLGYLIYGKTRTKRGQVEIVPEEERIKVMGTRGKLKTKQEHDGIMERFVKNGLMNSKSRRNIFPLSGLLYCERCGCKMQFQVEQSKNKGNTGARYAITVIKMAASEQKDKVLEKDFFNALNEWIISEAGADKMCFSFLLT
ncbi:recombinase family protein [Paenibacillus monticola]|uniref:recombinase family protein n=1 Tax=Paenibacillus monticola TaxID=2666075 RepID=UPI0018A0750A